MERADRLVEHFAHPRNAGVLADANAVGLVGAMRWGDALKLMLQIDPDSDRITAARFQTFGCSSAIASSSAVTEMVIGKTAGEALAISAQDIALYLGGLPAEHMYCAVMAHEAIQVAVAQYRGEAAPGGRVDATLLCKCSGVTVEFVERTIRSNALTAPDSVVFHTKAGRGCVACFRQIETVLARVSGEMAADGLVAKTQVYRVGSAQPRLIELMPRGEAAPGPKAPMAPAIAPAAARPSLAPAPSVKPTASAALIAKRGGSEQIALIASAIDDLRPHLQRDGGDCELVDVDGNTVFVKLTGSCVGCQLASVTLSGVQARLAEKLGQPLRVVPIQ
ncbi:MAG TPA: iron-sulfur cluster assembly scaffold protein [Pseudolabrys sp.]|nr:iron-sulfur cluster assembly scaffold protein [Pseudolabrys sp.]